MYERYHIVRREDQLAALARRPSRVAFAQPTQECTGEEGVQLAREQHPALVLMDVQLPGISGVDAFHQLREDPATQAIPAIAVTASVVAQDRMRIMAAGFDGFQGKPISVREPLATVRELLDKT